jgi:hypothetical protein
MDANEARLRADRLAEVDHLSGELTDWMMAKLQDGHDPLAVKALLSVAAERIEPLAEQCCSVRRSWIDILARIERRKRSGKKKW